MNREKAILHALIRYRQIKNMPILFSSDGDVGLKGNLADYTINEHCRFCEFAYIVTSWKLTPKELGIEVDTIEKNSKTKRLPCDTY